MELGINSTMVVHDTAISIFVMFIVALLLAGVLVSVRVILVVVPFLHRLAFLSFLMIAMFRRVRVGIELKQTIKSAIDAGVSSYQKVGY